MIQASSLWVGDTEEGVQRTGKRAKVERSLIFFSLRDPRKMFGSRHRRNA